MLVDRFEPLLGTVVEIRITGDSDLEHAQGRIVDEIVRLEHVFSAFDESSELSRWRRGEDGPLGPELVDLLTVAASWQTLSEGAFNPASGEVSALWADAQATGRVPDIALLATTAAAIGAVRFELDGPNVRRIGDCSHLNFNAIAKGYIVDRAVEIGLSASGVSSVMVNAGGDLLQRGDGSIRVGIEDPRRPYDNAAPLMIVEVADRGLATSGSSRRGFRIDGRWYSHVIDPRTGRPVDHVHSASVVAADAVTADVVATVVGVIDPERGIEFVDALDDVDCCIVDADGRVRRSAGWSTLERA